MHAHVTVATIPVDTGNDRLADRRAARTGLSDMANLTASVITRIGDDRFFSAPGNDAGIAGLTAAQWVEDRAIENNPIIGDLDHGCPALLAVGIFTEQFFGHAGRVSACSSVRQQSLRRKPVSHTRSALPGDRRR